MSTSSDPSVYVLANPDVSKTAARLYNIRDLTGDVKFKVGDEEFLAHKCVLATLSPIYEQQFFGDDSDRSQQVTEVIVPGVTADAFKEFLQIFYMDPIEMYERNIEGVTHLAKENGAESIYKMCIAFLHQKLTDFNVCKIYKIATLHKCDELIEKCEWQIKRRWAKRLAHPQVLKINYFIKCERTFLAKVLSLNDTCKSNEIFQICIQWARRFCMQNGLDTENNVNLRAALCDEAVEQIKFETMTLDEFMELYKKYRSFFSATDKAKIFRGIVKVCHSSPYWFDERISENDTSVLVRYTLVDSMEPIDHNISAELSDGMTFYSYNRASLYAICFGQIYRSKGTHPYGSISVRVKVDETNIGTSTTRNYKRTRLVNETCEIACDSAINWFTLQQSVDIKPKCHYRIHFEILESRPAYVSAFRYKKLAWVYDFFIVCKGKAGLVTGLELRFFKDEGNSESLNVIESNAE